MQVSSSTNSIFTIYSYYTDLPFTTNPGGFSRQPTVAGRNTLFFVTIQGANGLDDLKETRTAILRENTHPGRSGRFIQQVGEGKICWRRESQSGRLLKEQELTRELWNWTWDGCVHVVHFAGCFGAKRDLEHKAFTKNYTDQKSNPWGCNNWHGKDVQISSLYKRRTHFCWNL